jgi:hypothetical protein
MKNHSEENTIIKKLISKAGEEATMNQPFSNSAGMVILALQQNYLGQTPSQEEWDEFYSKCELTLRQLTIADFLKSDDTFEYQQTLQSELECSLRDSIDYILTRTNEKSNQFDYVTLYLLNENGTYSNVMHVFSLKYVLALVVKAHTDDARFACRYEGSAEERLEKAAADRPLRLLSLFRCFKKIQQEGICHQGIRNALILLLNKSYEGVDLIEDPTTTVFSFFREGVYRRFDAYYQQMLADNQVDGKASVIVSPDATEPRPSGSGIVQAFVRDSDLSGETMTETVLFNALLVWMKEANSRPLLAIIDPTNEIKNDLLTCFVEHGVDVNSLTISGQSLSDYIDTVSENIDFDLGMEKYQFLHDINVVLNTTVSNESNNNRKDAVYKMQNWIETLFCLKTPEHRTMVTDFLSIEQANKDLLQYQLLLMLTNHATQKELRRIEEAIQTYYRHVIDFEDIIPNLSEQENSEIDNLDHIIKQFKDDKCLDTIENFFAHWFGSMDNWLKILCNWTEGDCALDSNPLMIDGVETLPCEDWQRLNHLYSMLLDQEFVQSKIVLSDPHIQAIHEKELCIEGEHFVRHKTPYEINRIFLHAIVIKPDDWSALFSKTFEETLLFVKNQLDVGYIATELKKNSYPVRLITQLDYLYQTNRYINNSSETKPKEREINSSTYFDFFQGKNSQSNASPEEDVLRLFCYSDTDFVDRIRPFCGKFEDFLAHFKSKQKQLSLRLEFRSVFLPLNGIETDVLLEKIKNRPLDTIRDGVDLGLALQGLNDRQCKALLEIMGDQLPNIIRNGLQLGLALQYLNKNQCEALLEVVDNQLSFILCNSTQIKIVLLCLKEDTKKIVLERIHKQVLNVIAKEYDGSDAIAYLNKIEQNFFPILPNEYISKLKCNALNMYSLLFDKIKADIEEKVLVIVSPDATEPRPSGSGDPGETMTAAEENIADNEEIDSDFMASVKKMVDLVKRLRAHGQITNEQSLDLMEKTNQLIQDPSLYKVFLATAKGYEHVAGGKLSAYMMLIFGWAAKIVTLTYRGNDWINEAKGKLEQIKIVENVAECSQRQVKHANDRVSFTFFRNSCEMGEGDLGNSTVASSQFAY